MLRVLVDRAGTPVSNDALIEAAWPGLAVEASNLTVQIAALRRVLREEPGAERWIETLPRRGYRFVGPLVAYQRNNASHKGTLVNTADDTRNNLPLELTSFIGRAAVLGEIKGLLASHRLVTLAGVGGSGKTRLAIKIGAEVLERFADGVWLVEFAALSDPAFVPHAAMSALGISEQRGRPLMETLLDYMRSTSSLLILDNCEHLLSACCAMTDLILHSCPSVRILATSREPLGVAGEAIFRVPPLSLPDVEGALSAEVLLEHEASRLFIERANCVHPKFRVTSANATEIGRICARLDGLPLAIELAAARVRILSASQICARLDDQFRFLTSSSRTAVARHQTLGAMIDWSYELLSQAERTMLRRLSVFAGGWTLDAAESVCCSEDGAEKESVLDLVTKLTDKSLVVAQTLDHEARYSMLEPVRQFALTKLTQAGETKRARQSHLECFLALAERVQPLLRGSDVVLWRDRLDAEHDNLRAALKWSLESGANESGLRLAGALEDFWRMRGCLVEGRHWLDNVLAKGVEPSAARARALFGAGRLSWGQGDLMRATDLTEAALRTFRELGNKWGIARALAEIGLHSCARGEYERAALLADESLSIAQSLGDEYAIGYSLILQAALKERAGDDVAAARLLAESLAVRRRVGHKFGIANALRSLGRIALRHRCYEEAEQHYKESLSVAWEVKELFVLAPSIEGLSAIALARKSPERAARLVGVAEELRRSMGAPPVAWERDISENTIHELSAILDPAALQTLRAEGRAMTLEQAVPFCFGGGTSLE